MVTSTEYALTLTALAVIAGVATSRVMRRFSDREQVDLAKRQIRAQLYALRLFGNEPALMIRAQGRLLRWNARYLALMLRSAAVMLLPGILLFMMLDNVYGNRPLARGETATVTAQFGDDASLGSAVLAGQYVTVETPAVRLPEQRQACWRVRVSDSDSGSVVLRTGAGTATKSVAGGAGLHFAAGRRIVSLQGPLRWIDVEYPAQHMRVLGFELPWVVWFLAVSLPAAAIAGKAPHL